MQYLTILSTLGFVAAANAWYNETAYTTITTDVYTTVCPSPTTFSYGSSTYTITESTTLTITDCPCTYTTPISTYSVPTTTSTPTYVAPTSTPTYVVPSSTPTYVAPTTSYSSNVTYWTTTVVSVYTTYCSSTTISAGNTTYTVSTPTSLTVTNCPCTISTTYLPGTSSAGASYPGGGSTFVSATNKPSSPSSSSSGLPQVTGNSGLKNEAGLGALAAAGLAAMFL